MTPIHFTTYRNLHLYEVTLGFGPIGAESIGFVAARNEDEVKAYLAQEWPHNAANPGIRRIDGVCIGDSLTVIRPND